MPSTPNVQMLNQKLFITRTIGPWYDLFERWWDGEEWVWVNHGRPQGKKIVTAPGAAMLNEKLFVVIEDGSLWERHWRMDLDRWAWESHGRPENRRIVFAPSAPMLNEKLFVVTDDGRLWERHWRADLDRWAWQDHGRPNNENIVFEPGAAMLNEKLFVVTSSGKLWERHWRQDLGRWVWQDHGKPPGTQAASEPGAAMSDRKLFVKGLNGKLFERYWDGDKWVWVDHGTPPGTMVATSPGAAMLNNKLFVTGENGRLFERLWNGSRWVWVDHGPPPGTTATTAPGAAMLNQKLFVGTANERLFERFWNGSQWNWIDHGTLLHDTSTHLIDNRPNPEAKTIVVVGDGFAERDLSKYESWVKKQAIDGLFGHDFFKELKRSFNVVRVDLVSIDSGVSQRKYDEAGTPNDKSDDTIQSTTLKNTRLGYIYHGSWANCWLDSQDDTGQRRIKVLNRFAPDWDYVLVVLNENGGGGCGGGGVQVVTLHEKWDVIAHEFGHGIGGLADEYSKSGKNYTRSTFDSPNCSVTINRSELKWAAFVDQSTSLPTTSTPRGWDDNQDVGAFEGCGTYATGLFRPVKDCRMRNNKPRFCPVCEGVMREVIES